MRAECVTLAADSDRSAGNWVGVTAGTAAVLDGGGSWAEGCADLLGCAVLGRLADPSLTIESCLPGAEREVRGVRGIVPGTPGTPGARGGSRRRPAAAFVRVVGREVEWLVIGDTVVVLDLPDGLRVASDGTDATAASDGTDGTGTGRASAANWPVSGRVALRKVRQVAMLSSGAARLVTFGVVVWEQVMDTLAKDGPHVLVDEVRAFETLDPRCVRWPRSGVTADATVVHVRF
ncbi:hypothetical protein ACFV6E_08125 [Streptomyces sp. NPDC059785]|uniref:hypothetical protein n=1 Tax=unclassified Streptomyces TaxID=2593676 RepID=UPI00365D4CF3